MIKDEILMVEKFFKEKDEYALCCPHCKVTRRISSEDKELEELSGEQYQDNLCKGWFEISEYAMLVNSLSIIEKEEEY